MVFLMRGDVLKHRRAQRLGIYYGIMKTSDKNVVYKIAQRKTEQTEHEPICIDK